MATKFTEPARLKTADGGVADGIGPADVHQRLTGFPSHNGFLPLVVRQFRLAAHEHPSRFGTADLLLEDFGATGGLQLGNLRRQRLPICRYPPETQMRHFPSLSHVIYAQNIPFEINVYRFVHSAMLSCGKRLENERPGDTGVFPQ